MAKTPVRPNPQRKASVKDPQPSSADVELTPAAETTAHDQTPPDASVASVIDHARMLASLVRAHLPRLAVARIAAASADELDALAAALSAREGECIRHRDATDLGVVGRARVTLRDGRDQLFEALRTFADHDDATQRALDDIAGVENDDDLVQDSVRLLSLTERHAADLEGTDVTPARRREVDAMLVEFRSARAATRGDGRPVNPDAVRARALRNRAFWALALAVRTVVKRARYALRNDDATAALFTGYHAALRRRKKAAAPTPPTPIA